VAATIQSLETTEIVERDSHSILTSYSKTFIALASVAAMTVTLGLVLLWVRWDAPLLGMHSFRQTQTAITSYWILKGSPWLAYETPVFGAPWSIPFEFPIFQLTVAGVVKFTGLALDPTGRTISYLFLVLTILPVRSLAHAYGLSDRDVLIFAILLLASPIYLYWSTTFLIETMVLFFCVAFLAAIERTARDRKLTAIAAAAVLGSLGALGKITTFVPFYLLAGVIVLCHIGARARQHLPLQRSLVTAAAAMLPAPLLFFLWDRFADEQKARNPLGRLLISTTPLMHKWNFGTWDQLFSERLILTLIRTVTDTVGILAIVVFTALTILGRHHRVFNKQLLLLFTAAMVGFLCPYFVFTNLHIVHNYYDTANAVFLIFAISILIGRFFSNGHSRTGWAMLTLTMVSQLLWFQIYFAGDLDHRNDYHLVIARSISTNTAKNSVIAIYGADWSAVIPYYSQRRAIMEQSFAPRDEVLGRARNLLSPQAGYPVQAVVHCPSSMDYDPALNDILAPQIARLSKEQVGPCEVYLTQPPAHNVPAVAIRE
jgi:hypothetical protein